MHKEKKDKHFLKKPVYEGGKKAMKEFIRSNLRYPEAALKERIEGSVYLKYTINHKGKVIETKVVSSLGYGCDEEAERLVKQLVFKVPKTRGMKVLYHQNMHIHFRMPKGKQQPQQAVSQKQEPAQSYQYELVKSKKQEVAKPAAKKNSYTITIDLG